MLSDMLPDRIRRARKAAELTQQAAAIRASVPIALWSKYENGHHVPKLDTLERMAAALGVRVSDLTGETA